MYLIKQIFYIMFIAIKHIFNGCVCIYIYIYILFFPCRNKERLIN